MSYSYLSKDFTSLLVVACKKLAINHYSLLDSDEPIVNNNETIAYQDELMTSINPKNSKLSISFDNGNYWKNGILDTPIKNIIRVDKETFVFEILNGANPTYFGVTYNLFATTNIVSLGSDNNSFRMKHKSIVTQRPLAFVRNALYFFNQENRSYTRLEYFDSEFCRLQDSTDKKSVYLFIPNSTGYSVRKYGNDDKYNTTYTEIYNRVDNSGTWDPDILSFNVIKASDNSDCFIITKKDFSVKIDIPTMGVYSDDANVF